MGQNTAALYWKCSTNNIDSAGQKESNKENSAELGAPSKRIKHNIAVKNTKVRKWYDTYLRYSFYLFIDKHINVAPHDMLLWNV